MIKTILQPADSYTTILKDQPQNILDTIIYENQSIGIGKIEKFYIFILLIVT